jgi:hypothetical protein
VPAGVFVRETCEQSLNDLLQRGYVMLEGVFESGEIEALANRLSATLEGSSESSVLRSRGQTYGSRNLLAAFPEVAELLSRPRLREFTIAVLGPRAGIVRALYFDKPPGRSWSLPWHQDCTIAVKRNDLPSHCFQKPTVKAGVPHIEAPATVLENMLTLRIHLDPMSAANGPLHVIPGSHRRDDARQPPVELHARIGEVLAMRPLLSHSSSMSQPGTTLHRRIIHFEVAHLPQLPDGYEWHTFLPLNL